MSDELGSRLVEIEKQIRACPGQLIIIASHSEERTRGPGGCFAPDYYYHRREDRFLGLLSEAAVDFTLGVAADLPTARYVKELRLGEYATQEGSWMRAGLRFFAQLLAEELQTKLRYHNGYDNDLYPNDHELDLTIGDEAVNAWTEQSIMMTEIEGRRLWLQQCAELLGRPFDSAPELTTYRDQQRSQLLDHLWAVSSKLAAAEHQLQRIRGAKGKVLYQGGAITLVEDEESVRIHSMGPARVLNQHLNTLKELLNKADRLGLSDHAYVLAFRQRYFGAE